MALAIIPISPPAVAQKVRGLAWPVHAEPTFNTILQESQSGRRLALPQWPQPLWKFTFQWSVIINDPAKVQAGNTPWTDYQILVDFFLSQLGKGNEFAYQPSDSVQTLTAQPSPDASGYVPLSVQRGPTFFEHIQELNGVTSWTVQKNGGAPGTVTFSAPNTIPGYTGWVMSASPTWIPSDVITATFTYYYRCAFTEESLDFQNFMYNLWALDKLEIMQVRV